MKSSTALKPPPSPTPSLKKQKRPDVPPSPTPSRKKSKTPEIPPSPTPSLKKHRKHKKSSASPTPSAGSEDAAFDEMFKDDLSSGRSTPISKRRSRPKSSSAIREDADEFLEQIKKDQAALDRRMKKVEAKKFQSNMQSIKSAVEGPRIVGVRSEKDVSKFFTSAKKDQFEPKPKHLPNKDVSALQGVNLSKYFPTSSSTPTSAKASIGTPSSVSSVEGSPMASRKKPDDVELMKYFGPNTTKSSPSTPSSSKVSPAISRKNSVESPGVTRKAMPVAIGAKPVTPAVLAPKPPVVPLPPKKNILAFQVIKKSKTDTTVQPAAPVKNSLAFQPVAKQKSPSPKPVSNVASSPPKSTILRKSPDSDDKLFENLLKDAQKSPKPISKQSHIQKLPSPPKQPATPEDELFEDLLREIDGSPKSPRKIPSPKASKKSLTPPKRQSPNLDDKLFDDLLEEGDESLLDNFDEILGLPKKRQSPKQVKKKTSPPKKSSPRVSPKHSPPAAKKPSIPRMTVKRPPFKIIVPVKMQETLEEIYLASLSKLDSRSTSTSSLNSKVSDPGDLGKVDEVFEKLLEEPEPTPVEKPAEPFNIQPFQAPQTKAKSSSNGVKPPEEKVTSKEETQQRTVVSSVLPVVTPSTPTQAKKIISQTATPSETPKMQRKTPQNGPTTDSNMTVVVKESKIPVSTPVLARKVTSSPLSTPTMARKVSQISTAIIVDDQTKKSNPEVTPSKSTGSTPAKVMIIQNIIAPKSVAIVQKDLPVDKPSPVIQDGISKLTDISLPNSPLTVRKPIPLKSSVGLGTDSQSRTNDSPKSVSLGNAKNVEIPEAPFTPVMRRKVVQPEKVREIEVATKSTTVMPPKTNSSNEAAAAVSTIASGAKFTPLTTPKMPPNLVNSTATSVNAPIEKLGSTDKITPKTTPVMPRKLVQTQIEQTVIPYTLDRKATLQPEPIKARKVDKPEAISTRSPNEKSSIESTHVTQQKVLLPETPKSTDSSGKSNLLDKTIPTILSDAAKPSVNSKQEAQIPTKVSPKTDTQPPRERKLSSDEICFEELRKKHEAIFRGQDSSTEATQSKHPAEPQLVRVKEVDVPRTLSEFRSAMIIRHPHTEDKAGEEATPVLREKINELANELMPGANLDDVVDEIPIPAERKKSSFQKMFNKLQRAKTIAAPEGSSLKSLLTPFRREECKMEVIREGSVKKRSPDPAKPKPSEEPKNLMQINLDRSKQIKEKYTKQKAPSPPKPVASSTPKEKTTPSSLERKSSFKIQTNVVEAQTPHKPAPVPVERKQSIKKQSPPLVTESSMNKKISEKEDQGPSKPIPMERKLSIKKQSPPLSAESTPKPLERKSSVRSQQSTQVLEMPKSIEQRPSFKLPVPKDIDRQQSILSREPKSKDHEVRNFDDLLDSVDARDMINFDNLLSSGDELDQKRSVKSNNSALLEPAPIPAPRRRSPSVQEAARNNSLSEKDFKQTSKELTEKFLSKAQPKPEALTKVDPKLELMMTTLTEPAELLEQTDLSKDSNHLKASSCDLPDIVNITKKQAIEAQPALKILDHTEKIKQITSHIPQEIQVYTLHTEDHKPAEPQPSTSGVTSDYASILKDISSGLMGTDIVEPVFYEPPPTIDRKPKSDFTTYKQILQDKAREPAEHNSQQPQRPLRKPKPTERSVSPAIAGRPFDNSICIDPWRAKRSSSIENLVVEQVFVKKDDKVVDTFYIVPEQQKKLKRRSKSFDRLQVPGYSGRRHSKKSLEELRDFGFDIEPPGTCKNLVNPRLRHLNFDESDEDLSSLRNNRKRENLRKCQSSTDTSKLDVEASRVDIDRESPIPRSTDFSKWEAILDRGIPYYKEPPIHKKEDIKSLERKLEDLKTECKPRRKISGKTPAIPKDYDPEEYVPRINRRALDAYDVPDSDLPKWYDPDEYVPRAQRNHAFDHEIPVSSAVRSRRLNEFDIPTSSTSRPQRSSAYEMDVPISRTGGRYYPEPLHLDDLPMTHTLPKSKITSSHVPYTSSRTYDLPSRDVPRTRYSHRPTADSGTIVNRSQRLHEKANKYIRSQVTKNDPNPYIREMLENESDDDAYPITTSTSHRVPITTSSFHPISTYGTSGSAAMSRIATKAITQPSRMTHYTRKDVPSSSGSGSRSYRRGGGDHHDRRDNCTIS